MMLPILISVSVAPVSYFFWASAAPEVRVATAVTRAAVLSVLSRSNSSLLRLLVSVLLELTDKLLADDGNLPCAVRHEENDEEEQHAEHGAGEPLGDALGDVRHEDDEGAADDRARQ